MLLIEATRAVAADVARMPRLVHAGIALAVVGVAIDLIVHLSPAPHHHGAGFRPQEHIAHLVAIAAMVLVLAGIALDGARRHRFRRRNPHAHR